MIGYSNIKSLAFESINDKGEINKKIADFVLNNLTKKELKIYLRRLKKISKERSVQVKYEGNMNSEMKKAIEQMYKGRTITYERDKSFGGGIMIVDNDLIVNYTIDSIIKSKLLNI